MPIVNKNIIIRKTRKITVGFATFLIAAVWIINPPCATASVYHATTNAFARRISAKGINPAKFRGRARFGKKFYVSTKPSTALAEKGSRSKLIRMKTSKYLKKNSWDLRRPNPKNLRPYIGKRDFRGTVKRGVIGPKLGHKIGRLADQKGKAIRYRSVKNGGTNIAVPGSMLMKHPRGLYSKSVLN